MSSNPTILLENRFWIKMPKMDCFARLQSRHLNVLGKFRKPETHAKGHLSIITKVSRLENLGTRGEGYELSTPARLIKDLPLLIMMWILFTLYALVPIIRLALLCLAQKYRLIWKNWNASMSCLFEKYFEYEPLKKVISYVHYSNILV